jgi:hypothetical protein
VTGDDIMESYNCYDHDECMQQSNIDMAIKTFTTIDEVVLLQKLKRHELLLMTL